MLDQYKILITELESELNFITIEIDDPLKLAEKAIESISSTLSKIKTLVIEASFQSQDDEIDFFKNTKPKILSKLIYYSSIYKIETKKTHDCIHLVIFRWNRWNRNGLWESVPERHQDEMERNELI